MDHFDLYSNDDIFLTLYANILNTPFEPTFLFNLSAIVRTDHDTGATVWAKVLYIPGQPTYKIVRTFLINDTAWNFMSGIDVSLTETKGTVLIKNAQDMLDFSKGEEASLEASIKALADAGVKVVVSGSGIGELAMHFLNRYNMASQSL